MNAQSRASANEHLQAVLPCGGVFQPEKGADARKTRRSHISGSVCTRLFILAACVGAILCAHAQSNLVFNGDFDYAVDGWSHGGVEIYWKQGAAHGEIHVGIPTYLYQNLSTVPGRDYVLTFASGGPRPVEWAGVAVTNQTNFGVSGPYWKYMYAFVHADSNVSRLLFRGYLLDDVKVRWVQDPIEIIEQPLSRTAFEGGSVGFFVNAEGPPPLRYQWYFDGTAVAGANSSGFVVTGLRSNQAGQYSVRVSNAWNSVYSATAQLQVLTPPGSPVIVSQPVGDVWPAGYACSLSVFAVGEPPLRYQWHLNGDVLPGATNSMLTFNPIQTSNAGVYSVVVTNALGSVVSLPAALTVTNSAGGGTIFFDTFTNNSPVYDVDGVTLLAGPNYVAQAYAGRTTDVLRPLGIPVAFYSAGRTGYLPAFTRQIPDVPSGQTVYVQLRAWEAAAGSSYEQARASGGKFGASAIYPTPASNRQVATKTFKLRAGEPFFVAGQLSPGESLPDGRPQFVLTGEPAARYLIETRQPPNNWVPFLVLTNTAAGTTVFTDTNQSTASSQFYRARLLD